MELKCEIRIRDLSVGKPCILSLAKAIKAIIFCYQYNSSSFLFSELRGTNLIGFRGKDSGVIDMSFKVKTKL